MSVPPGPRSSQPGSMTPPANYPQPLRGSSIFAGGLNAPLPPMSRDPSRAPSRIEPPPLSATMGPMPGTVQNPLHGPRKRLIVTCDGTWLDNDNGKLGLEKKPPSNVARIGWAIKDTSRDGIPQIVHYQAGVGTAGTSLSKKIGGATGNGLKNNVHEGYSFLAINYRDGDEIFLMGFSRGAYTARTIAAIIGRVGLLTRKGLPYFNEIFEDVEHQYNERYVSAYPDIPFRNHGPFSEKYAAELHNIGMTRRNIMVKAVCCWDTVGSLGIPHPTWLENISRRSSRWQDYQFDDTIINEHVENAFQALALDEHRGPFSPAIWEKRSTNKTTNLKQVWFPGVHSNVGGGYNDQEIANLTLAWMMSRLEPYLDFRSDFLMICWADNRAYYKASGQKTRWWGFGRIYNSYKGLYSLAGSRTRTPGNYFRVDPRTGRPVDKRLKDTNEYIHASVRARIGIGGPGTEDKGVYDPPALRDWDFELAQAPPGQMGNTEEGGSMIVWRDKSDRKPGGQDTIPEAILMETELTLLRQSAKAEVFIRTMQLPKRKSRRHDENGGDDGALPGAPIGTTPIGPSGGGGGLDTAPLPPHMSNHDLNNGQPHHRRRKHRDSGGQRDVGGQHREHREHRRSRRLDG